MMAVEQARYYLEQRGCAQAAADLDNQLEAAAHHQRTYAAFWAERLGLEITARRDRSLRTRTRLAHLPVVRTLEPCDFSCQPSIDERQMRELATLTFGAEASNVLFLGPPEVGKMVCGYSGDGGHGLPDVHRPIWSPSKVLSWV
jgi:DNA replication protein DnaC